MPDQRHRPFGIDHPLDLIRDGDHRYAWRAPRSFVASWCMAIAAEAMYASWLLSNGRDDDEHDVGA